MKRTIFLTSLLAIFFVTTGCSKLREERKNEDLKVGVISGLTGQYADSGINFVNGIVLAKEIWNNKNPGKQVKLVVEDDGFHSTKGLSAYKKLIEFDKIDALINFSSPTIDAIYPLVSRKLFPVIQAGEAAREPENNNVFQIMPGNIEMEKALGRHVKGLNPKQVVFFWSNVSVMSRFADAFREGFGKPLYEYKLGPGDRDFKTVVTSAMSNNPDTVVLLTTPNQGPLIIREIIRLGKNPHLVFDGNLSSGFTEYKEILGDLSVLDESDCILLRSNTSDGFKKKYKERFNQDAGWGADLGFDAFTILIESHSINGEEWIQNTGSSKIEGASGTVKFDNVGIRIPTYEMKKIKGGEIVDLNKKRGEQ